MGSRVEMVEERKIGGREWLEGSQGKVSMGTGHAPLGLVGPSAPHSPYMVISRLFSAPVFLGERVALPVAAQLALIVGKLHTNVDNTHH